MRGRRLGSGGALSSIAPADLGDALDPGRLHPAARTRPQRPARHDVRAGKKAKGINSRWNRDVVANLGRLRQEYATDVLVSLGEEHELGKLQIQGLPAAAQAAGIVLYRFAIQDGGVPANAAQFAELVKRMVAHVQASETVVIHCRRGLQNRRPCCSLPSRSRRRGRPRHRDRPRCASGHDRECRPGGFRASAARDFEHGVRLAVNHGCDSDSTGSLVGNLLGAMWGVDAIPERWLDQLELRGVIDEVAHDVANLRTGQYGTGVYGF
jgi:hypothetical protein